MAPNPDPDVDQSSQSHCLNKETKEKEQSDGRKRRQDPWNDAESAPLSRQNPGADSTSHGRPIKIAPHRFGKRPWRARCPRTVRSVAFSSESMAGTVGIVGPPGFPRQGPRYQGRFRGSSRGPSEMAGGAVRAAGCIARSDVDEMSLPGRTRPRGIQKEALGSWLPDGGARHGAPTACGCLWGPMQTARRCHRTGALVPGTGIERSPLLDPLHGHSEFHDTQTPVADRWQLTALPYFRHRNIRWLQVISGRRSLTPTERRTSPHQRL